MSRASLSCAASIFNIRRKLQEYKESEPPETDFYKVSRRDLLDMLNATMTAWYGLEEIETETSSLISYILDALKTCDRRVKE